MEGQQRLPAPFLEGHRGYSAAFRFVVGPDDAFVWNDVEIFAIERHGVAPCAELEAIFSAGAYVHVARQQRHTGERLWHPPPAKQFSLAPRLEDHAGRSIEDARDHELPIGPALDGRTVLSHGLTMRLLIHPLAPVSFPESRHPKRQTAPRRVCGEP